MRALATRKGQVEPIKAHQSPQQRSGLLPALQRIPSETAGAEGRKDALMMATCAWPGQQTNKRANEQPGSGAYWQAERENDIRRVLMWAMCAHGHCCDTC